MLKKWKLWYARRQLAMAIKQEEEFRAESVRFREEVIPALERELETAELDLLCQQSFNGMKNG